MVEINDLVLGDFLEKNRELSGIRCKKRITVAEGVERGDMPWKLESVVSLCLQ